MIKQCFTNFTERKVTTLYQAIIRPALEYASPVWNPWYKQDIEKLEKVQRKCLKLCSTDIQMESLENRRKFTDCVETYKFVHNKYKTPASVYFKKPARELRGHSQKLVKQHSRIEIRKNFFSNRVIDTWNTLRDTTVQDQTSPVWNPWYKQDIEKLEKVQRKCLKLCSTDIQMESLENRRKFTDCVETYKFVHNKYKTPASVYFKKPARELRGHSQKLVKQHSRIEIRKNFFSNRVIDTWNTLRDTTVQDQTLASMKQKLRADL